MRSVRRSSDYLCLACGLATAWGISRRNVFVLDDAFISLRYARNLVEGYGLVYNPGLPPVEGYTNFLWVLFEACLIPWTEWPEQWLLLADTLCGLLLIFCLWRTLRLIQLSLGVWIWFGVLMVAANGALVAWMSGGLETMFFSLLVFLATSRFLQEEFRGRRGRVSSLFLGCALLTRPEAYLLLVVLATVMVVRRLQPARRLEAAHILRWVGTCALFAIPHITFRRIYYGEWLPNTFFVKIGTPNPSSGIPYLLIFSRAYYLHWAALMVVLIGGLWPSRTRSRGERATLSAVSLLWLAYVIYAGGDHFEFRLLAPIVPLLGLLLVLSAEDCWTLYDSSPGHVPFTRLLAVVGAMAFALATLSTALRPRYGDALFALRIPSVPGLARANYAEEWRPAGEWLFRFALSDERISTPAAGIIPWISQLRTLDMHGLNDREIAHRRLLAHGVIAHEKTGTWEDVKGFGVSYHIDDLRFFPAPSDFGSRVLEDPSRIVVQLATRRWMNFGSPSDAGELRAALRNRGAVVYVPSETNRSESEAFTTWSTATASDSTRRRRSALLRLLQSQD